MSSFFNFNLINFLDFYFSFLFFVGTYRRLQQYYSIGRLIYASPTRWPRLLTLLKDYRMLLLTWGTVLPALLALGAKVEVATAAVRAILPLEQWLAAPPEAASVIEALVIPVPAEPIRWAFRKGGLRAAFTPSVINVAGLKEIEGDRVSAGRLAVGGGVVSPMRVRGAEALITGRPLGATTGPRYIWRCLQKPPLRMTPSAPDAIAASSQRTRLCMLSAESC